MTVVYLLGPAKLFSQYAQRVIEAGGVPVGDPLVAALPSKEARVARYGLLGQASVVFAMPGWREEWVHTDVYLQAEHEGKTIFTDLMRLYEYLDEEVRPEDWLELSPPVEHVVINRDKSWNLPKRNNLKLTRLGPDYALAGRYGL